jgi:hypothetical protein
MRGLNRFLMARCRLPVEDFDDRDSIAPSGSPPNRVLDAFAIRKGDGGKKAGHRGDHEVSRKPSAGKAGVIRLPCGPLVRFVRTTAGAIGTRLSLCPLIGEGKEIQSKPRAYGAARLNTHA